MGLFYNFNKPGPGVEKDAPKKKGIFRYFEIFRRKFGKLIQLNMLYFLCSIPLLLILYFLLAPSLINMIQNIYADAAIAEDNAITFAIMITMLLTALYVIIIGSGPASAASAYIQRSFSREEHVWLVGDFFAKFKENFKQGIIVSIVDIVIIFTGFFAISFYYQQFINNEEIMWFVLMWILVICMILYIFMHCYIYQLMVTFENKITNLYKNALLLTCSTLPFLILITIPVVVAAYFIYTFLTPIASLILTFLCVLTYLRFPFEFYTESVIRRRILDTMPKKEDEEASEEEAIFSETVLHGSDN